MDWFLDPVKNQYADFEGRTARKAFWMFILISTVISFGLSIVESVMGMNAVISSIFSLIIFVPSIAIGARRLHDVGKSGWWQLIAIVPLVGIILLIVWWAGKPVMDNTDEGATLPDEDAPSEDVSSSESDTYDSSLDSNKAESENTSQGFGQ